MRERALGVKSGQIAAALVVLALMSAGVAAQAPESQAGTLSVTFEGLRSAK